MITRQRYVLDTSAFTNAVEGGDKVTVGFIKKLTKLVQEARVNLNISCYIPIPTIYDELQLSFKRLKVTPELITEVDTWFVKKTPNRYEVKIPAQIFYDYITDIRERINKGLRVSEEAVKVAIKEDDHGPVINTLRDKYRSALREGILDSKEDFDVLLLAKEMDATVVSADEGIRKWAERLGLKYIEAKKFPIVLEEFLESAEKA